MGGQGEIENLSLATLWIHFLRNFFVGALNAIKFHRSSELKLTFSMSTDEIFFKTVFDVEGN